MESATTGVAELSSGGEREARRTLARIMVALGRAKDPREVFDAHEDELFSALKVLGPDHPSVAVLKERGFISARPPRPQPKVSAAVVAPPSVGPALEAAARRPVQITDVAGNHDEGFRLRCEISGTEREVFALRFRGEWVFSHESLTTDDLEIVRGAFLRHFDITFLPALAARGADTLELHAIRRRLRPIRTLWPSERDPQGLCDDYPRVFVLENGMGTEHRFYCGFDPDTKHVVPYDHR